MGVHPVGGSQAGLNITAMFVVDDRAVVMASATLRDFMTKYPSPSSTRIVGRSLSVAILLPRLEADALGDALADADALLEKVDVYEVDHPIGQPSLPATVQGRSDGALCDSRHWEG